MSQVPESQVPAEDIGAKIDRYFALEKEIHNYFQYQEDWVTIPLNDNRECYWHLIGEGPGICIYSPDEKALFEMDGKAIYSGSIYTQRFLPQWVYRGEQYTLVSVDTQTDGNKYLYIFDNKKERKDISIGKKYLKEFNMFHSDQGIPKEYLEN